MPSLWWTTCSCISSMFVCSSFFFLQVFVIVGAICSVSHRKERAPNLGEEWALSNSLSFPIWNFMHIPNRLKSNHKVWKKKKKKLWEEYLEQVERRNAFEETAVWWQTIAASQELNCSVNFLSSVQCQLLVGGTWAKVTVFPALVAVLFLILCFPVLIGKL